MAKYIIGYIFNLHMYGYCMSNVKSLCDIVYVLFYDHVTHLDHVSILQYHIIIAVVTLFIF